MLTSYLKLVAAVFFLSGSQLLHVVFASNHYVSSCNILANQLENQGFQIDFYEYPEASNEYRASDFYTTGYKNYNHIGQCKNVNQPSLFLSDEGDLPEEYNAPASMERVSSYTMVATGYFLAPFYGNYQFTVSDLSGAFHLSIGAENTFPCCQQQNGSVESELDPVNAFSVDSSSGVTEQTLTVYLLRYQYYPIRFVLVDALGEGQFNFEYMGPLDTDPSDDFTSHVFSSNEDSESNCANPIVSQFVEWGSTTASSSADLAYATVTNNDDVLTVGFFKEYVFYTPEPTTVATTTTSNVVGLNEQSTTTSVITSTDPANLQIIYSTVIVINVPLVESTTTVYDPWAASTTRVMTDSTYWSYANGTSYFLHKYFAFSPFHYAMSTIQTAALVSATTTYSTGFYTQTGTDSSATLFTVYYVETPIISTTSCTTTVSDVADTTTYSTATFNTTDAKGGETIATVYYVATPYGHTATTANSPYTGSATVTYSTSLSTMVGDDGKETEVSVFYVETPIDWETSTVYAPETVLTATTTLTSTAVTTGSNGKQTNTVVYYVATPIDMATKTVYLPYNGSAASHDVSFVTTTGLDGKETVSTMFLEYNPVATATSTVNVPYSGSTACTYSTFYFTTTGENHIETDGTIYYVSTPFTSSSMALSVSGSSSSSAASGLSTKTSLSVIGTSTTSLVSSTADSSVKPSSFGLPSSIPSANNTSSGKDSPSLASISYSRPFYYSGNSTATMPQETTVKHKSSAVLSSPPASVASESTTTTTTRNVVFLTSEVLCSTETPSVATLSLFNSLEQNSFSSLPKSESVVSEERSAKSVIIEKTAIPVQASSDIEVISTLIVTTVSSATTTSQTSALQDSQLLLLTTTNAGQTESYSFLSSWAANTAASSTHTTVSVSAQIASAQTVATQYNNQGSVETVNCKSIFSILLATAFAFFVLF